MMNIEKAPDVSGVTLESLTMADRWILSKVNTLAKDVTENLDRFELGIALQKVYDFIWEEFCDWLPQFAAKKFNEITTNISNWYNEKVKPLFSLETWKQLGVHDCSV